jgi:rare lipoprotein A
MKILTTILLNTVFLFSAQANAQEFGKASYLDLAYQGAITASGEPYDGNKFTAAHKIHPFGTKLRITRQDNGRSVIVRINDRGPHIKGRIVDLSYAAAKALDMVRDGTVDVKVEVVSKAIETGDEKQEASTSKNEPVVKNDPPPSSPESYNNASATVNNSPGQGQDASTTETTEPKPEITNNQGTDYGDRLLKKPYSKFGLYEIKVLEVNKAGYGVQVASLSSYENAMKELTRLQGKNIDNALLSIESKADGQMAFKVIVGPYENRATANQQISRLRRSLGVKGFLVDLGTIEY